MLKEAIDEFFYDYTTNELRLMHAYQSGQNITYNTLLYTDLIACKPNCTVSDLANLMHVAKSAVTIKIKELEKQGIIEKIQSETDKRVYYLSVKPEVIENYKVYDTAMFHAIKEIEATYSSADLEKFCGMLQIIGQHFSKEVQTEVQNG